MSTTEHLAGPAAAAGTGAVVGKVVVARAGLSAAGMVGSGTGIGMAAGPFGMIFGALGGLALYALLRAAGDAAEEYAEELAKAEKKARKKAKKQAMLAQIKADSAWVREWVPGWAEDMVEVTGDPEDRVRNSEAEAAFDAWLERMFDGLEQRPEGWPGSSWMVQHQAAVEMGRAGGTLGPGLWWVTGVRLRDLDEVFGDYPNGPGVDENHAGDGGVS